MGTWGEWVCACGGGGKGEGPEVEEGGVLIYIVEGGGPENRGEGYHIL